MPELPEVETVVRTLAPRITGRRIEHAEFYSTLVLRGAPPPQVAGRIIQAVRRAGKHIVLELDEGAITIHLGMTGKLLADPPESKHTRAKFFLNDGVLVYDDIRMFGRISSGPPTSGLGPDALTITSNEFATLLKPRKSRIKPLLLNQNFISGMGNIYTDEALFRAGIHPRALASKLSRLRASRLHDAMVKVLSESIAAGGSSISDYVDAEGRRGSFQRMHRVYGREGQQCFSCGTPIKRIPVAQRGTHYCPNCQR